MTFRHVSKIFLILLILPNFCQAQDKTFDLNLDECLQIAYQNNKTLLQLQEQINAAKYKMGEARSGFFPELSFSGTYTRLGRVPAFDLPGTTMKAEFGTANNYNLRLSLQQPLFTWGRIKNSYDISKYGLSLSQEEYRKNQQQTKFNVTNLFYNILLANELIKVREESINRIEDHLRTVQERYDKGYASEFDVLRVRVQLANAKPPLVQAKNVYQLTLDNLKNLLGISLRDSVNLEGTLEFVPIQVDQIQAEEFAFENRSELKLIQEQKGIGRKALALAKAGNKPSLFGSANYEYKRPYYSEDKWKTDWNFNLALSFPIFDGFLTRSKVRGAKSHLKQVDITENQIQDLIRLEISQAISDLNLAQENILSQQENVKQAKESLRIANVQYQKGMLTNLELMDTEFALTVAETNHLQALSDYLIAKASYDKALGKD
ncbi:MAG: TolC family protein [candidate division Zixibacteria bacterium]|nr:TolC family protein [candidate division Zixibacteria bacterium]